MYLQVLLTSVKITDVRHCFTLSEHLAFFFFFLVTFSSLLGGCLQQETNGAMRAVRKRAGSSDSLHQLLPKL